MENLELNFGADQWIIDFLEKEKKNRVGHSIKNKAPVREFDVKNVSSEFVVHEICRLLLEVEDVDEIIQQIDISDMMRIVQSKLDLTPLVGMDVSSRQKLLAIMEKFNYCWRDIILTKGLNHLAIGRYEQSWSTGRTMSLDEQIEVVLSSLPVVDLTPAGEIIEEEQDLLWDLQFQEEVYELRMIEDDITDVCEQRLVSMVVSSLDEENYKDTPFALEVCLPGWFRDLEYIYKYKFKDQDQESKEYFVAEYIKGVRLSHWMSEKDFDVDREYVVSRLEEYAVKQNMSISVSTPLLHHSNSLAKIRKAYIQDVISHSTIGVQVLTNALEALGMGSRVTYTTNFLEDLLHSFGDRGGSILIFYDLDRDHNLPPVKRWDRLKSLYEVGSFYQTELHVLSSVKTHMMDCAGKIPMQGPLWLSYEHGSYVGRVTFDECDTWFENYSVFVQEASRQYIHVRVYQLYKMLEAMVYGVKVFSQSERPKFFEFYRRVVESSPILIGKRLSPQPRRTWEDYWTPGCSLYPPWDLSASCISMGIKTEVKITNLDCYNE